MIKVCTGTISFLFNFIKDNYNAGNMVVSTNGSFSFLLSAVGVKN